MIFLFKETNFILSDRQLYIILTLKDELRGGGRTIDSHLKVENLVKKFDRN